MMKLRHLVTRPVRALLRAAGYEIVPATLLARAMSFPFDFSPEDIEDFQTVQPYTMVPRERIYTLARAVEYIVENNIAGAFVECGTWRGGCAMEMARVLKRLEATDRDLCFYDLFGEMWPRHTEFDVFRGVPEWERNPDIAEVPQSMRYSLEEVRRNIISTGYPPEKVHLFQGMVEKTLPANAPDQIALLRLDTDFYESTLHELTHLYPRLSSGGVLIIDDYGDWAGSRKAADEYIHGNRLRLHLVRIDEGARVAVKP